MNGLLTFNILLGTYALVAKIRLTDTVTKTFATEAEALERIKTLRPYRKFDNSLSVLTFGVREVKYTHANQHGYSDVYPFEIVRAVSDKTIELRSMAAERAADWKPEIVSGGFAGHCTNNGNQSKAWVIKSDPDGEVVRARLQKDGSWKSVMGVTNFTLMQSKNTITTFNQLGASTPPI